MSLTNWIVLKSNQTTERLHLNRILAEIRVAIDGLLAGGSSVWGAITGTLSDQTDLQAALDAKEDAGVAATLDAAHVAALDPHPQYLTAAEGNAAYDALGAADAKVIDSIADSDTTHAPSRNAVFDALALKAATTYVDTQDAATLASANAYADGKVLDSIADSDTTHAPSRNAVFDALALKAAITYVDSKIATEEAARIAADSPLCIAGGTVDALTLNYTPDVAPLDGRLIRFRAAGANLTTTPTILIDGVANATLTKKGGQALAAGDIAGANFEALVALRDTGATLFAELLNPATDATGGGGSGSSITASVTQTGHGFSVGMPISYLSTGWVQADADDSTKMCDAVVSAVADANNFTYTMDGLVTTSGLTSGEYYWLSTTAGTLTTTIPTTGLRQLVGKALSTTVLYVMLGEVIDLNSTGSTSSGVSSYIPLFL